MLKIKEKDTTKLPPSGSWPGAVHEWDRESILAVNTALTARRPLLIRGEPGVGKSQIARAAAVVLKRVFISEVVHARSESKDLQYSFDAVRRLAEAQALGASRSEIAELLDTSRFINPGCLWWCFNWKTAQKQSQKSICGAARPEAPEGWNPEKDGCVLLLDEIDKADADLPNGLLETLGNGGFTVPYINQAVTLDKDVPSPLIVITTNEERELPAAFLRRCMVLQMHLPKSRQEFITHLSGRGKIHFGENPSGPVREEAARQLWEDRENARAVNLPLPGQAEYLDILRALKGMAGTQAEQLACLEAIRGFAFQKHPRDDE